MAFRRQIFKETGFRPDVFLGKNYGNGETGLMIDIVKRGYLIAFVPEAFIFHHMDSSRFNLEYVRRTASYMGIPTSYYRWHKKRKSICRLLFNGAKVTRKYYRTWSKLLIYRIFSRNITSRRVGIEFRSYSGLYQLMYIYWLATDPFCRACCDMEDFRPESCSQIYRDHYEKKTD